MDELPIPPAAVDDGNAVEMIRLWIAGEAQWVTLNPHLFRDRDFDEEEGWGLFLADTIQHISNAISQHSGDDSRRVSKKIKKHLLKELKSPRTTISGGSLEADNR